MRYWRVCRFPSAMLARLSLSQLYRNAGVWFGLPLSAISPFNPCSRFYFFLFLIVLNSNAALPLTHPIPTSTSPSHDVRIVTHTNGWRTCTFAFNYVYFNWKTVAHSYSPMVYIRAMYFFFNFFFIIGSPASVVKVCTLRLGDLCRTLSRCSSCSRMADQ